MTAQEIINTIELVAPLGQQEGWDNSGLQVGQRQTDVCRVLLCTDVTDAILSEAINKQCQMIISHHPLLFHGLKRVEGLTMSERCVIMAIQHGIVIYSSHTAMDTYLHGVSGYAAEKLGITDYRILSPTAEGVGLGVIGELPQPISITDLLKKLKETFVTPVIRYVTAKDNDQYVQTIAFCGGAGSEFIEEAVRVGADAYISADFKYHDFQLPDGRISVFDIGHFESEQFTKEIFRNLLQDKVECILASADCSPIKTYY